MRVDQLETPALVLDLDAMERNMRRMEEMVRGTGLALRPHYKSHKCTAIARMQLAAGAKGITCAKLGEAEDLVRAGVPDVLLANQVTAPQKVMRLGWLAGCCKLTVCVDDRRNVDQLAAAATAFGSTIHCLVEYDMGMGRCGVGSADALLALARQIADRPGLAFAGIQAYAGHLSHEEDFTRRKAESAGAERTLTGLKAALESAGFSGFEISGGSSGTAQFRGADTLYTELQAGSYLFMDAAYNALGLPFENALFLLAGVVCARPGRLVLDAGVKALSTDQYLPVLRDHPDWPLRLNEEHCCVTVPNTAVPDEKPVWLVPGHCCTTVNLHDQLTLARGGLVVDRIPITSRGRYV